MTTTRWAVVRLGCALGAASALFHVTACGRLAGDGVAPGGGGAQQGGAGGGGRATLDPGPVAACQANASLAPARVSLLSDAQFTNVAARTMSDFWVQTAQAWGDSEMTSYGAPMWNKGPMPGLYG